MNAIRTFFYRASYAKMVLLCLIVGIGGGLGAIIFHYLIEAFAFIFYGPKEGSFLESVVALPWYVRLFTPALGGLIVGIILSHKEVRDAEGEGVPEVIEAIAVERSKIQPLIAPVKAFVSAVSVGSGGAGGREGPIIQIGSAIGSSIAQSLRLDQTRTRTLLAAGAAAALGGTFGAPIAGVLFAVEVLLKTITISTFFLLATAAAAGAVFAASFTSMRPPFDVPALASLGYIELLLLATLGIFAALVAAAFTYTLTHTDRSFKRLSIPHYLKPAVGGFLLGGLALLLPQIHEQSSYRVLTELFTLSSIPAVFLIALIGAKILATSLTVGSGGSGGILAPSLFIGALFGSAYSKMLAMLLPSFALSGAPFLIVGMGAVFAGTAHAPLTAIALMFELTDSYYLLAPLIVACFTSAFIAQKIGKESMYSAHLSHRSK